MPRHMSFALTTEQIRGRTKTVTRRKGWLFLRAGDRVIACAKCMGLRRGEKLQRLATLEVVDVRRERLTALLRDDAYGAGEAAREGFPGMTGQQFVEMFCRHMRPLHGCATEVTRIEFRYVSEEVSRA